MSSKEEKAAATNVQVAVRCRPPSSDERKSSQAMCIVNDQDARTVKACYGAPGKKMDKSYTFDKVFGTYSTQADVFNGVVSPIVQEVLQGFNCTIFAYGQTGTGKTHTMQGVINSEEDAGIVPRAVKAILEQLEAGEAEFTIRVSFLELYNEELQDLLSTNPVSKSSADEKSKLKLCEDSKKGGSVVCQGLEEITVLTVKDIMEILERGIQQRQTAETLCNKNSSRSHSIFTLKINIREYNAEGEEVVRLGQLNLVDLAGSECVGRSGAKNDRAREAGTINQSLLSLGRVITALVDHHSHIPYRDSKLTRLLQDSLGGKAKTCIIATLSPCQSAIEETLSTLDYASRAKNIKNKPQQNEKMTKKTVMKEYCAEIETLRTQLQLTREKNGVYVDPEAYHNMVQKISSQEAQLTECEGALKKTGEDMKALRHSNEELGTQVAQVTSALGRTETALASKETECEAVKGQLSETRTELCATEAVVSEQTRSEAQLTQTGAELLEETACRKGDIAALLGKVEVFAGKEALRSRHTAAFVQELGQTQAALGASVSRLSGHCAEHAAQLCDGVAKMLAHGKGSCASLQSAIDAALEQLGVSSKHATGNMATACDGLDTSLQGTNKQIDSTLLTLQAELSRWLTEVDASVGAASAELATQQTKIAAASDAADASLASHVVMMETFVTENAALSNSCAASARGLKAELTAQLKSQEAAAREGAQQRAREFEAKAEALKQQFLASMADLVQTSTEGVAAAAAEAESHRAATVKVLTISCDNIETQIGAMDAGTSAAVGTKLVDSIKTAHAQSAALVAEIDLCRETASGRCGEIGASVGARNADMQQTVTGLVGEVNAAIRDNCAVVRQTAVEATTLHSKVQEVSGALSASAGASLDEFTALLVGEGDALEEGLKAHFDTVGTVVAEQEGTLLPAVEQQKAAFSANMNQAVTTSSGATPTKAQQVALPYNQTSVPALAATRPHADIKQEVYDGSWTEGSPFKPSSTRSSLQSCRSSGSLGSMVMTVDTDEASVNSVEDTISVKSSAASTPTSADSDSSCDSSGKKKRKLGALQPKESAINASPVPAPAEEGVVKAARLSGIAATPEVVEVVDVENVAVVVPEKEVVAAPTSVPTRATRGTRASKIGAPSRRVSSLR